MHLRNLPLIVALSVPAASSAGLIERDLWGSGDGLITFDSVNRREWLDLPTTLDTTVSEVQIEMEPGGRFEGFQFATRDDVLQLADAAGVPLRDSNEIFATPNARSAIELLDWMVYATGGALGDSKWTYGQVAFDPNTTPPALDDTNFYIFSTFRNSPQYGHPQSGGGGDFGYAYFDGPFWSSAGPVGGYGDLGPFWLYREAIPEPNSASLLATIFAALFLKFARATPRLASRPRCRLR